MTNENTSAPNPAPDLRTAGEDAMRASMPGVFPDGPLHLADGKFGEELVDIGTAAIWGSLWAREGLTRRDRSLITLAILTTLGTENELKSHVRIGLNNGLSRAEIAEVIYHTGGYAGFPRAMVARAAAREALGE